MFDVSMLPKLKGASASIVLYLLLNGNRTVSMNDMIEGTGYSDKPLKAGLQLLIEKQIITRPRVNRYQLTGKNMQLPLYWDETIEALPESGESPEKSGNIPELMQRIEELEKRVWYLENRRNSEFGETPENSGESPKIEILPAAADFGETPEKTGDIPEKSGESPKNNSDPIKDLINIYTDKEVSKKVSKEDTDTYLLENNNTDNNFLLPAKTPKKSGDSPKISEQIPELFAAAWKTAMVQMENNMGRGSYKDILYGAVASGYEDGHYTITMDNVFKRDWAEARLTEPIEKILSVILSVPVSVSFVIDQQTAAGSADPGEAIPELPAYEPSTPVLLPEPEDPQGKKLAEICNDYLLDPAGIDYSMDQLRELMSMGPDPDVLRFVLPIATQFENAKWWCEKDLATAKRLLLKKYKIVNGMAAAIVHNDAATLEMIKEVCDELCPDNRGAVGDRIRQLTSDGKIPEL